MVLLMIILDEKFKRPALTLTTASNSVQWRCPTFAACTISSCLLLLPAATAFAVAKVTPLVACIKSSGVAFLSGSPTCRSCKKQNYFFKPSFQIFQFLNNNMQMGSFFPDFFDIPTYYIMAQYVLSWRKIITARIPWY